jgi:hypothetical protein
MKTYTGGCHCGAVRYEVDIENLTEALDCNCSHCASKGMLLHFVPKENFRLLKGADNLTSYKFNKEVIDHVFCKTCGVQSFSQNDSWPKMAINVRCLDDLDLDSLEVKKYDGKNA